ncbi:hypothetical protein M440DRAFT_1399993 [Trichoderma longibrachiatum ATCC 18648]|uniref:Uncharacterized protein n=1 Tax=Trichoderma longibrachiatum ATCC 18648 TaxID=983965 RepID=A0A2T4CBG8_TRILO|nr:hypothetical protein M440DRAFT_1399993 [Trichoderma longibrachiatum ATCC 18648]
MMSAVPDQHRRKENIASRKQQKASESKQSRASPSLPLPIPRPLTPTRLLPVFMSQPPLSAQTAAS